MQNWKIGRVLGIPINVHPSWIVVFLLVTWSLATGYLPETLPHLSSTRYWAMGALASLLLFGSVLLHELGHSFVALRYRIPIGQITLFVFGGMAQMRREPPGPLAEFLIAIAGPIVSFLLAGFCLGMVDLLEQHTGTQGFLALGYLLGAINLQLGLFNLIPGFPLDGGRVLRAGLWAWSGDFFRATQRAALVGQGFGILIGLLGGGLIVSALTGRLPTPLATNAGWIILIGGFLYAAARAAARQARLRASLASVSVEGVMARHVIVLDPSLTIEEAVKQYFVPFGYRGFPVHREGRFLGMVSLQDVQAVPSSQWPWRRIEDVYQPRTAAMETTPEASAVEALEQMAREDQQRLAVIQNGRLVGLVTRSGIARILELSGSPRTIREA
jgi:Zn-dependent protease/predicted transcriptional regulator